MAVGRGCGCDERCFVCLWGGECVCVAMGSVLAVVGTGRCGCRGGEWCGYGV